jgi:hypothetical protein
MSSTIFQPVTPRLNNLDEDAITYRRFATSAGVDSGPIRSQGIILSGAILQVEGRILRESARSLNQLKCAGLGDDALEAGNTKLNH